MEQLSLLAADTASAPARAPLDLGPALNWSELRAQLGPGCVVLTANKRLARRLLEQYAEWRYAQGEQVWARVDILPWQPWCQREWERPLDQALTRVLSEAQSERLWRRVISAAPAEWAGERIHPVPGQCVQPAADAWALLQAHGLGPEVLAAEADEEARILACWIAAYQAELSQLNALDPAQLPAALAQAYAQGRRPLPRRVVLAGFHEIPPALHALLQQLLYAGVAVQQLARPCRQAQYQLIAAADSEAECRAAAEWARQRLSTQPQAKIALIVIELKTRRALLERVFNEVLQPQAALGQGDEGERPFNISLGWPLAEEPLVHDALLALRWLLESLDFPSLSLLLRSPFIVVHSARQAALELRLREMNLNRASLDQVLKLSGGQAEQPWRSARWTARWRLFRRKLRGVNGTQSPLFWAQQIAQALDQLGWGRGPEAAASDTPDTLGQQAGQRALSSREYQALGAFHQCLERLAELHTVVPQCGLAQALHELEQLAQQQIFQPQQNPAPILITEPLQALGLEFDALWLMGASDELWPEAPRPNPLLPLALQRRYDMPHASAAHELHYAQTLTRWLCDSADAVVLSWPLLNADKALRPSPLITALASPLPAAPAVDWRDRLEALAAAQCETFSDVRAPPLEATQASGGAALIKEQSACPFRALVLHRWRLRAPAAVSAGLNAAQRGQLLHRALELLYTLNQGVLAAAQEWPAEAAASAAQALEEYQARWPVLMDERLRAIEAQRLRQTLLDWLALDAERPTGFTVKYQEEQRSLTLGPLRLQLRVDRLDLLADGSGVLIDYKGGQKHSYREWFGPRPREPQLPLYALALAPEMTLAAVAFGNLKAGQRGYTGLAREDAVLSGADTLARARLGEAIAWEELSSHWRAQLSPLAQSYADGWAAVDPRDAQVCRRCELAALCRIRDGHDGLDPETDDAL